MELYKRVLLRFIRGGIASAVSTMIILLPLSAGSWRDIGTILTNLSVAGTMGFITGFILAIDKWFRDAAEK